MKLKTSITLDEEVVAAVEAITRNGESRSQVIERLLRESLAARTRSSMDERDLGIINAHADELNEEALDVLGYQVET
jgi:metal-responsive CopG/Arc/MetJ family transcriptional regulator